MAKHVGYSACATPCGLFSAAHVGPRYNFTNINVSTNRYGYVFIFDVEHLS